MADVSSVRRGYLFGIAAYLGWGFFPLYFKLLEPAGPNEILAHRIVWSTVFMAVLLAVLRRYRFLREFVRQPKRVAGMALAAVLIGLNWFGFIYGVGTKQVVEISLGYFITPLVSVVLGVLVLRERLRPIQWVAVGVGGVAVIVQAVDLGRLPWLALLLAASFGSYGLLKKQLGLPAAEGMFVESTMLVLPALVYLIVLAGSGDATVGKTSVAHTVLIVLAGVMTALPLMSFAEAANRVPLTALGILQYIAPIMQLATGVLIFHEPMPPARLAAFGLVWMALVVFTWDGLRQRRARLASAANSLPAATAADSAPAATAADSATAQRTHQNPRDDREHERTEAVDGGLAGGVGATGEAEEVDRLGLVERGGRGRGRRRLHVP
ncbi:protein RarD [Virgisporangium aurantiacum]|uniref:Protein RarD n=1 Tax=Virgisporangium aurantiacum TaxID=175570 RepID=A0A8J3Z650_9ACTN|nr:protein RarD [Virgisporangium aurantiacum]